MSTSISEPDNKDLPQSLLNAIDLGLLTQEQAQSLTEYSEEEIQLILEQIVSDQMEGHRQCVGDQCQL